MDPTSPFVLNSGTSRLRLQTIVRLRWIAVLGQTVTVLGVYLGLGFDLPIGFCLLVIALSAWLNVFLRLRYPASHRLRSDHAAVMLGYDVLQLAALLYLTGGLENPFAFLLLVPVTVSASTLPPRITLGLGALALACAGGLAVFHLPLPWRPGEALELPFVYTVGTLVAVISGIVFLALYAWRIAKEARQMSNALAATEMVLAREQKLSALDGLAAAAAHGLGTPLSTITVVAKELLRELPEDSPYHDDVVLLQSQARRCRDILSTLSSQREQADVVFSRLPLSHLVEEVVEPHREFDVAIEVEAGPMGKGLAPKAAREPVFARNPGVLYGLGNLVENAVDFAHDRVTVEARWDADTVTIVIRDDGPGIPPVVLEHLGEPYMTTRGVPTEGASGEGDDVGLGLGYFIAKTLLERSGARLTIQNRGDPVTGAEVQVVWPRRAVDVEPKEAVAAQPQA